MKIAKKTAEYTVLKRADGRYAVQGKNKSFINGEEKVKILTDEGFLSAPKPKAEEPAAEEETATEEGTSEAESPES